MEVFKLSFDCRHLTTLKTSICQRFIIQIEKPETFQQSQRQQPTRDLGPESPTQAFVLGLGAIRILQMRKLKLRAQKRDPRSCTQTPLTFNPPHTHYAGKMEAQWTSLGTLTPFLGHLGQPQDCYGSIGVRDHPRSMGGRWQSCRQWGLWHRAQPVATLHCK